MMSSVLQMTVKKVRKYFAFIMKLRSSGPYYVAFSYKSILHDIFIDTIGNNILLVDTFQKDRII